MAASSADSRGTSPTPPSGSGTAQKFWEFADLGFDTGKKLWFVQFYNATNENVGTYFARSVDITGGWAAQYQWKDSKGAPFWHVRERFYATEIERLSIDPGGGTITLVFKQDAGQTPEGKVPLEYSYILYAYHLSSKDSGRAPMGFVDFYGADGTHLARAENRWIIVEGLNRRTFGEYPGVRIRADRKDIGSVDLSNTAIIIKGKTSGTT